LLCLLTTLIMLMRQRYVQAHTSFTNHAPNYGVVADVIKTLMAM